MRMLVLGGTRFVSHAVAVEAVARGHEVVCAARGRSGTVARGARLVEVDRDVGLDALAGASFDAVVDVAAMSYPWVLDALRVLGPNAGHWTFVSTVNVYTDTATRGQTPGSPVHEPLTELPADYPPEQDPELYGATKVAAEDAVREVVSDRAFVVWSSGRATCRTASATGRDASRGAAGSWCRTYRTSRSSTSTCGIWRRGSWMPVSGG